MKEFIISEAQSEKAVLVGLITPQQNEQKVKEYLDELAFLADTAGVEAVKCFYQKLDGPNSVTFVGTGKLQEIKEYVVENEIGTVIFDDELSAKQLRNIEKELQVGTAQGNLIGCLVADRAVGGESHFRSAEDATQGEFLLVAILQFEIEHRAECVTLRGGKGGGVEVNLANKVGIQDTDWPA